MKEAAGEANLTVIAVVLIGIVAMVAYPLITSLMQGVSDRSECANDGGVWNSEQGVCEY